MNILIGGIGGDIGLGAARILNDYQWKGSINGADISNNHPGHHFCQNCYILPYAENNGFLKALEKCIKLNDIAFYIPTSETEIRFLSSQSIKKVGDAEVLLSNDLLLQNSLDKFSCLNFLNSKGIKVPSNGLIGINEPEEFPVIIKPRNGSGSRDIKIFDTKEKFASHVTDSDQEMVWQKYLLPEDEFTCPVFRSPKTGVRSLIIKRTLLYGFTYSGEVIEDQSISKYLKDIAETFDLNGIMNIQLRVTNEGPLLFEINPRLSSTLVFRHLMGFRDLIWWLNEMSSTEIPDYLPPKAGTKFYRGLREYFD